MRARVLEPESATLLVLDEYTTLPATLVLDEQNAVLFLVEGSSVERLKLHVETPIHLSLGGQLTVGSFQFTWVAEAPWLDDESELMSFTAALVRAKQGRYPVRTDWPRRGRRRNLRRSKRHFNRLAGQRRPGRTVPVHPARPIPDNGRVLA